MGHKVTRVCRWPVTFCLWLFLIAALEFRSTNSQVSYCGKCFCVEPEITCNAQNANIKSATDISELVPSNADMANLGLDPNRFDALIVNCQKNEHVKKQVLRKDVLSLFRNIKKLSIQHCDLTEIQSDALQSLIKLEDVSLGFNSIKAVPKGLFEGLGHLQSVTFQGNKFLLISEDSFIGLSTTKLILSECAISKFPYNALKEIRGLKKLAMSDNNIEIVPIAAKNFIVNLEHFFINGNPISCTCPNRWMIESIDWKSKSPGYKKSQIPTCKNPYYLMDIELSKLKDNDFQCEAPKITDIQFILDSKNMIVKCTSESTDESVHWSLVPTSLSSQQLRVTRPKVSESSVFHHIISKTPFQSIEQYHLTASSLGGNSNLSFSIRWPTQSGNAPPDTATASNNPADIRGQRVDVDTKNRDPNTDYFSKKQFTLLEMIFAVIGTFMGTLLVFILVCQFVTWYKKRDKKRWATYVPAPYGGPYNGYNGTMHQPPSHHEYDVPQITQPCLPQSPPGTEFFDYKTQRMLYHN